MRRQALLVTGFDAFGGDGRNPSAEVLASLLADPPVAGLVGEVLPVVFAAAGPRVERLLAEHTPAAWVGLGLHGRARSVVLERRAANVDDAGLADNAGDVRRGVPIDPAGPAWRPATVPWDAVAAALTAAGLPVAFSDSAGAFLCNHVFYRAAAAADRLVPTPAVGFIHLPWPADWPRSGGAPPEHGLRFDDLRRAMVVALQVIAGHSRA